MSAFSFVLVLSSCSSVLAFFPSRFSVLLSFIPSFSGLFVRCFVLSFCSVLTLFPFFSLSVFLFFFVSFCLSLFLSLSLSLFLSFFLSFCLPVFLPFYLSFLRPFCLPSFLSSQSKVKNTAKKAKKIRRNNAGLAEKTPPAAAKSKAKAKSQAQEAQACMDADGFKAGEAPDLSTSKPASRWARLTPVTSSLGV